MSIQTDTRVAVSPRWIRAALAGLLMASCGSLMAQTEPKKDSPRPEHKTAAPASKAVDKPAGHSSNPPAQPTRAVTPNSQPPANKSGSGSATPAPAGGSAAGGNNNRQGSTGGSTNPAPASGSATGGNNSRQGSTGGSANPAPASGSATGGNNNRQGSTGGSANPAPASGS